MHRFRFQRSARPLAPDDAFNQQIAILIAAVAILAAIAGFLQVNASGNAAEASRDAERLAIEASGQESRGRLNVAFEWDNAYRQWSELEILRESAEIDYFDDRAAARYATVQKTIQNLSQLLSNDQYFDPETEDANLSQYEASEYLVAATVASEQRLFRADVAGSWGEKADSYVIILTIIASALLLLGLSSTVHDLARWLFLVVGGGMAIVAAIWILAVAIDAPGGQPDEAAEAYARGIGLAHQGRNEEAIAAYDEAIDSAPDYGNALYARANARTYYGLDLEFSDDEEGAQEAYAMAVSDFEAAREAGRNDTGVGWNLGWAQYLTGDLDAAIATDREVLEADPSLLGVRTNLALALLARGDDGDVDEAEREYAIAKDQVVESARQRRIAIAAEVDDLPIAFWSDLIYLEIAARDLDSLISRVSAKRAWTEAPTAEMVDAGAVLEAAPEITAELKGLALALEETGEEPPAENLTATVGCFGFGDAIRDEAGNITGVEPSRSFQYGVNEVVTNFDYEGIEAGQDVVFRVYRNGVEQPSLRLREKWTLEESGGAFNRGISYAYGNRFILSAGDYEVEMYVGYHLAGAGKFSILTDEGEELQSEFTDDFSDRESGWSCAHTGKAVADYTDDAFEITVDDATPFLMATPGKNFGDVAIEVDATKVGGTDENSFGVVCRYRDRDNFYMLTVGSDGFASIFVTIAGEVKLIGGEFIDPSIADTSSGTIHLRAECVGSEFTLYANDVPVAVASDESFAEGDVGLIAVSYTDIGTEIRFDDFSAVESPADGDQ